MQTKQTLWQGFNAEEFEFDGAYARIIHPNTTPNGKWALKTEYADAFPDTEIELLKRGWHVAFNTNQNRWAENYDLERKARFIRFITQNFNLEEKCTLIGMSCGGMYAVKLTALYPELVNACYLDAPVMNLLSCPCTLGMAKENLYPEYFQITGRTISQMLSYRDNPIDKMDILLKHDIPILLVAGDSDITVPFEENGMLLDEYYRTNGGRITTFIKKGCGHHPHGLENPSISADIIERYSK